MRQQTGINGRALVLFAGWVAALCFALCFAGGTAHAQGASIDDQVAQQEFCNIAGCGNGGGQATTVHNGPDPCYLALNAMRPCTSADMEALKPHGVDPNLVGTWEIPMKGGLWVLTINANGTYAFHSDAHGGAQAQAGSFAASNGAWTMKAKTGYADSGNYLYQAPNIFIATGNLGAASWLRPDLAQTAVGCTVTAKKVANPTTLDANLVGTWRLAVKTGDWVMEIAADGTYKFHSEAQDGAPWHAGVFTASKGEWTLAATTGLVGYTDSGHYLFQSPNIWMAQGNLGGAAWIRPCSR
jgi:hypothetical protein